MGFVIFSAGYNCAAAARRCLDSVRRQSFRDFVHVVVDDASTDPTWAAIVALRDERVAAHRNDSNRKWVANALAYLKPADDDIVVILDLDDWLFDDSVLAKIAALYEAEHCWLTYGDYVHATSSSMSGPFAGLRRMLGLRPRSAGHCRPFPADVLSRRAFRDYGFCSSHLRTFKGFLWNDLSPAELNGPDGRPAMTGHDAGLMYALLERCEPTRIRYVPDVLYVYNDLNPLNDHKIAPDAQKAVDEWFRSMPKRPVLTRAT